jgi:hypothetical protein
MVSHLLDRIVCAGKSDIDKIMDILPFIIIGAIWLIGMLVKSVKSSSKKDVQPRQPSQQAKPRQPDLNDFIKMVKQRYAEAKEQVIREEEQRIYRPQQPLPPKTRFASRTPQPAQPSRQQQAPPSYAAITGLNVPEPQLPQVQELPIAPEPGLPDLSKQIEKVDEIPEEMTALDHRIYDSRFHSYLPELTHQLANRDGLRIAIIYNEIFGKPLALRD